MLILPSRICLLSVRLCRLSDPVEQRTENPCVGGSNPLLTISQSPVSNKLTGVSLFSSESKNHELVSGLFAELENDPDFMKLAVKWGELSDELKQAILRMAE